MFRAGAILLLAGVQTPPATFATTLSSVKRAGFSASAWVGERPAACQRDTAPEACKTIRRAWDAGIHEGDAFLSLWVLEFAEAEPFFNALFWESDEFGGVFGKAPKSWTQCGPHHVVVTVGTYRESAPHDRLIAAVSTDLAAHCPFIHDAGDGPTDAS